MYIILDVVLGEIGELPIKFRHQLLADRFLLSLYEEQSCIYDKIHNMTTTILTSQNWIKKPTPVHGIKGYITA